MHYKRYLGKVLKNLPKESISGYPVGKNGIIDTSRTATIEEIPRIGNAFALYDVLRKNVDIEKAISMAAKLTRYELDRYLFLDQYNSQIVKRIRWINKVRLNNSPTFVANFKELLDSPTYRGEIIILNSATMIDTLNHLKMEVGMSTTIRQTTKEAIIRETNLLIYRINLHLPPGDQDIYNTGSDRAQQLEDFVLVVRNANLPPRYERSIIAAINLVKNRLKYIQ